MISMNEYCEKYNITRPTFARAVKEGRLKTAKKTGRRWMVSEEESFRKMRPGVKKRKRKIVKPVEKKADT